MSQPPPEYQDDGSEDLDENFDPESAFLDRLSDIHDGDYTTLDDDEASEFMSRYLAQTSDSGSNTTA